jgi:predicted TIM-barrel fold metal-dependent hydrolase
VIPWPSRLDEIPPSGGLPGSDVQFTIARHLERHKVGLALLLPTQPLIVGTWVNADEAAMIARGFNDCFIEHWLRRDPRFRLAIVVSPLHPELAAKEIRRVGQTDGVIAVMIPLVNTLLGDNHFHPIYEAAEELDLPVLTHPIGSEADFHGGPVFAGGIPGGHAEKYCMYSQLAMSHTVNLIFQGTFERFPRLRIVFIEYGWTWVAPLLWRMDAAWKAGRRLTPWVRKAPSQYVRDHIRFTTQPALEPPNHEFIEQILTMMDAEHDLLFSTDYPHWDSDDPDFVFRTVRDDLRRRIYRENALETFPRMGLPQAVASAPAAERGRMLTTT